MFLMMRQLKIEKQITSKDTVSLDKYLHEIGRVDLLSATDEIELAKRIKKGDPIALETLVKANLRFVVSVSKQYQNKGVSLPDLINEGNLGLITAAKKFDETRGFKFISYAVWWIRQSILQALAEQSRMIRLPQNKIAVITKINKSYILLEQMYHREPTATELSEILHIAESVVADALNTAFFHYSLDAPIGDDENDSFREVMINDESVSPDADLIKSSLRFDIDRSLSKLDERDADIIRYFFGLSGRQQSSLEEISRVFGLSKERVRQIKDITIKKMQNGRRCKLLKAYL